LFREAEYIEGILGPGECLYIPRGWWHYVRSESVSIELVFGSKNKFGGLSHSAIAAESNLTFFNFKLCTVL